MASACRESLRTQPSRQAIFRKNVSRGGIDESVRKLDQHDRGRTSRRNSDMAIPPALRETQGSGLRPASRPCVMLGRRSAGGILEGKTGGERPRPTRPRRPWKGIPSDEQSTIRRSSSLKRE